MFAVAFFLAALLPMRGRTEPVRFSENFASYQKHGCMKEGSRFGPWSVLFTGFGCVRVEGGRSKRWLRVDTARSRRPTETHAVFVAGPSVGAPLSLRARVMTLRHLREGSKPNPWEVGWLVWDYRDNNHFYYFVPRANGWELGKRDPRYPAGQRVLASGSRPAFPRRVWSSIRIEQSADDSITIFADGRGVVSFTDEENPYLAGRVGFYDEDSRACIADFGVEGESIPNL